jgi:hypothetical protein
MNYGRYLMTLVVVAIIVTGSAFAWKTMTRKPAPEVSPSPTIVLASSPTPQATESTQLEGKNFILENATVTQVEETSKVVVRFTPESAFTNADKLGITKRVIDPYKLYQDELDGTQELLSIDITQNTQASAKEYPFLFSANFDGGVNESFVIARQGDTFAWFVPECLGACPFGKKFTVQYPEIVKLSKGE